MPDEAEVWLRPYWGGFKHHLAVWSPRFAVHRARCNSNMELDDQRREKPLGSRCTSCLKWAAVDRKKK